MTDPTGNFSLVEFGATNTVQGALATVAVPVGFSIGFFGGHVKNKTLKGHWLHPGFVDRIIKDNGASI